ncbi:MAG: hypothetical protein COT73_04835, partial [Bdellovibrio sp. CG10_big_fil_rev_8_21_14_0_10_47_8]
LLISSLAGALDSKDDPNLQLNSDRERTEGNQYQIGSDADCGGCRTAQMGGTIAAPKDINQYDSYSGTASSETGGTGTH